MGNLNDLLDYIIENGLYTSVKENVHIKNVGIIEDTINGRREIFVIERKIYWWRDGIVWVI